MKKCEGSGEALFFGVEKILNFIKIGSKKIM